MITFISSFLGAFIGTAIVTSISAYFFYNLGRKHERELNEVDKRIEEFKQKGEA